MRMLMAEQTTFRRLYFVPLLVLAFAFRSSCVTAQSAEELMGAKEGHCSVAQGAIDGRTFACQVWDNDAEKFSNPDQIEIYRNHKRIVTIKPGSSIREWHFWKGGNQIAIHFGAQDTFGTYALYDTGSGIQVIRMSPLTGSGHLPQWAKGQTQLNDESVPETAAFSQQRALWIAKVLKQIDSIHPGMTRKDLLPVFRMDGGLSGRTQSTYVYKDCPYIKVDVVFSAIGPMEDDEDRVLSISRPYLAFPVMD
jgi:hypothetical protein